MKRRSCWCPKLVLWEMNSFLMQMISLVPKHLHRCWPREWKHSIGKRNNRKRKLFKQVRGSYYRHQSKLQLNIRVFCSRVPYGPDLKSNKEKPMLKLGSCSLGHLLTSKRKKTTCGYEMRKIIHEYISLLYMQKLLNRYSEVVRFSKIAFCSYRYFKSFRLSPIKFLSDFFRLCNQWSIVNSYMAIYVSSHDPRRIKCEDMPQ